MSGSLIKDRGTEPEAYRLSADADEKLPDNDYMHKQSTAEVVSQREKPKPMSTKMKMLIFGNVAVLAVITIALLIYFLVKKKNPDPRPPFVDNFKIVYHLIAHTHDDLGWLIRESDYNNIITSRSIRTSSEYLAQNKEAQFSYAEMGFLKHWTDTNHRNIEVFKKVVKTGQMEIVNGGMAVHDTANVYFDDIITNYEYGREYAYQNYDYIVRSAWLIDPFGLSLSTTRLYAEMGYDHYVLNRISDWEKEQRKADKALYLNWSARGKPEYAMFTNIMANHYQVTDPFNIDTNWYSASNKYPITDITDPLFNLSTLFQIYTDNLNNYHLWFSTRSVMIPWGGDFYFRNFNYTKYVYDSIIIFSKCNEWTGRFANATSFRSSTVGQYFDIVKKEFNDKNIQVDNKTDDFFPLVNDEPTSPNHCTWSGYFVTDPYSKRLFRTFGEAVRGLKSILTVYVLRGGTTQDISVDEITSQADLYHYQIGLNTHHDTITGTSRAIAAQDYIDVVRNMNAKLNATFNMFIAKYFDTDIFQHSVHQVLVSPLEEFAYIPVAHKHMIISTGGADQKLIRFRAPSSWTGVTVNLIDQGQSGPAIPLDVISSTCNNRGNCEHAFMLNIRPMQARLVRIQNTQDVQNRTNITVDQTQTVTVDGNLARITVSNNILTLEGPDQTVKLGMFKYTNDTLANHSMYPNGKYIFSGDGEPIQLIVDPNQMWYSINGKGKTLDVHISLQNNLWALNVKYVPSAPVNERYTVRFDCGILTPDVSELEANYVVRYYTPILNGKKFVTDSNGLEKLTRTYGSVSKVVDQNYYPLTRFIYIEDDKKRFGVLVDRAQGGTSTSEGVVEIMINRRSIGDDWKGASEPAFENLTITVLHYIVGDVFHVGDTQNYRRQQIETDNPVLMYQVEVTDVDEIVSQYGQSGVRGLYNTYPLLRVLFDKRADGRMMMRLYNYDEYNKVELSMTTILDAYGVHKNLREVTETGIDFNFKTADMNEWKYNWNPKTFPDWKIGESVALEPLQIRTFEISAPS